MKPSFHREPAVVALSLAITLALAACNRPATPPADTATPPAANDPGVPPATAPTPPTPAPPAEPAPPPTGDTLARFDGYGDMRLGMTADEAKKAWGGELNGAPEPGGSCYFLTPGSNPSPAHFGFMIEEGKFVRYDVGNDREVAPGGGKQGMSADEIKRLYVGRVEESPHKYSDGKYLRIKDTGGSGVLVFETDADGKVTEWRVGVVPQVDYVEGCS